MKYALIAIATMLLAGCGPSKSDYQIESMRAMANKKCAAHNMTWDNIRVDFVTRDVATVRCLNITEGTFVYEVIPAILK